MDQVVHNIFPTAVMEFKLPFDTATIKTQLETYNSQLKPHAVFDGNATTTTCLLYTSPSPRDRG